MSIFDKLIQRIGREVAKLQVKNPERWQLETADAQQWNMPDPFIYATQSDMYRLSNNLGTAIDVLSNAVGLAEFDVYRQRGEKTTDITNHPFEQLLNAPNPRNTKLEFFRDTVSNYKLNGNAVWWLNRTSEFEKPRELWNIPFHKIRPVPDGKMYLSHYMYSPGGGKEEIPLPLWQIVHFKTYNPDNDFVGLSPLESLANTIGADFGMRKTSRRTYTEFGGSPQSILAFKDYVPNEAWDDIKKEKQAAAMRNEMMMLRGVGDGVSWMSRALSSKDMEFIASLRQNMIDIFNRTAPGLLAMLDSDAKYSNANAGRNTFDELTLWPMLELLSQKITMEILPSYGLKLIGKFEDPRQTDRNVEMKEIELFSKFHTLDEVREAKYSAPPIGDERGKLLVSQINSATGDGSEPEEPELMQPIEGQPQGEQQTGEPPEEEEEEDEASKLAIADLNRVRRMVERGRMEKVQAFKSDVIRREVLDLIRLRTNDTKGALAYIDRQIDALKPKARIDPLIVLKGLEATVKALEMRSR